MRDLLQEFWGQTGSFNFGVRSGPRARLGVRGQKKRSSNPDESSQDRNSVCFGYSERKKSRICCCFVLIKPLKVFTDPQASLGGTVLLDVAMQ